MSTTDNKAAFEAWYKKEWHTEPVGSVFGLPSWKAWQAATEAAKATGTASHAEMCIGGDKGPCNCGAEAARQPAPVVAVKTWQERVKGKLHEGIAAGLTDKELSMIGSDEMQAEIADLRAALASTKGELA